MRTVKWAKLCKEDRNSIQDEDRSNMSTIASTPEMVDSVYALILSDRRVTAEDISELLGISVINSSQNSAWLHNNS